MRNFDVFICVKDADNKLFKTMISRVIRHIKPRKVIIATTENTIQKIQDFSDIIFLNESSILNGLNIQSVKNKLASLANLNPLMESNAIISRSGWYLQQFLKMAFALYSRSLSFNYGGGESTLQR